MVGGERVPGAYRAGLGAAVLPAAAFRARVRARAAPPQPSLLIVAPMSGHYPTLLRGTVEAFLPNHDVYITEWIDARMVPLSEGRFDLDDYIDYVISMLHFARRRHPYHRGVPALGAGARRRRPAWRPRTTPTFRIPCPDGRADRHAGQPDRRQQAGRERGIDWFRRNVITKVPFPNPGFMRDVYPGFLQLNGFVSMNLDRHIEAHRNLFLHLVKGDGDSAQKHREFYDEYLAVMDLTAEFYLQTVETVFVRHALPKGEMIHRDVPVDPRQIRRVALLTIEGEHDEFPASARPKRRIGCASTFRPSARRIGCSPASVITACSTVRVSAPKSRRASPTSCCRT